MSDRETLGTVEIVYTIKVQVPQVPKGQRAVIVRSIKAGIKADAVLELVNIESTWTPKANKVEGGH